MGKRGMSPEAQRVLGAIKRAGELGFEELSDEEDELEAIVRKARHGAEAQIRRYERVTWEEKRRIFEIAGKKLSAKQEEIASDNHTVRVVRAGRRSGKTTLAAFEAAAVMAAKPGSFGWIVGPDYGMAYRCWEMFVQSIKLLESRGVVKVKRLQNTRSKMVCELTNGSVCEGESADNGDSLQGTPLDFFIMDEIAQIEEFVFMEIILPALLARNGWACLIGTPIEEPWASRVVRKMEEQAAEEGVESEWKEFLFESWHNTFVFPGGRWDEKIVAMEKTMDHDAFMSQVCAQPQFSRYRTYPEFMKEVHAREVAWNPEYPVVISIDPSTGVNPYAVAVLQDYGDEVVMVDEYYHTRVIAEDVIEALSQRPWWGGVKEALMDDAWPQEIKVWRRSPKVHFTVRRAGKSHQIEDSIPVVRQWLRAPFLYNSLVERKRDEVVGELYEGKSWYELKQFQVEEVMKRVQYWVENSEEGKEIVLRAAKFFVDKGRCPNVVREFAAYQYRKPKREDRNPQERPIEFHDHLLDALRYFFWSKKREGGNFHRPEPYQAVVVPW